MPLASADPDVRLDDLCILAAGLLERLAREQRAFDVALDHDTLTDVHAEQGRKALATTRGEAAFAVLKCVNLFPAGLERSGVQIQFKALEGFEPVPSDTLDAWAMALRSAT